MKHLQIPAHRVEVANACHTAIEIPRANRIAIIGAWFVGALQMVGLPALAQAQPGGNTYGRHMMWDGGWPGMIVGSLMMILFFAAIVAVAVLVVRWLGGTGHRSSPPATPDRTPLDILKERFVRGEIDKAEYEERRRLLES